MNIIRFFNSFKRFLVDSIAIPRSLFLPIFVLFLFEALEKNNNILASQNHNLTTLVNLCEDHKIYRFAEFVVESRLVSYLGEPGSFLFQILY